MSNWMRISPSRKWMAIKRTVKSTAIFIRNERLYRRRSTREQRSEFPRTQLRPYLADRFAAGGTARGHYFHQDLLVAQWVYAANPRRHIDVGSRVDGFVAHVASFRPVEVVDVRPASTTATGISFRTHDIMAGTAEWSACTDSLSCLHSIEHFGLGRYGDPVDPEGWRKGWAGLVDMVEVGGSIYLSTVIGTQRLEFDGQRVFAVTTVLDLVRSTCSIERAAYVDDSGDLHVGVDVNSPDATTNFGCEFGCLILHLRRLR